MLGRILALVILICLVACLPIQVATIQPTQSIPTKVQITPSETVVWFPATAIPSTVPAPYFSPTPDLHPGLTNIILIDDFSQGEFWQLGLTQVGSVALGNQELSLVVAEPRGYVSSVRSTPVLGNFYLEITASPSLCRGADEYGLLLRMTSPNNFYRFSLSCDGRTRLDRVINSVPSSPQPWLVSPAIPPGAPSVSHLAVWANGKEMRFFIENQLLFSIQDPLLLSGNTGLFARSAGDTAVTINFSNLVIWELTK